MANSGITVLLSDIIGKLPKNNIDKQFHITWLERSIANVEAIHRLSTEPPESLIGAFNGSHQIKLEPQRLSNAIRNRMRSIINAKIGKVQSSIEEGGEILDNDSSYQIEYDVFTEELEGLQRKLIDLERDGVVPITEEYYQVKLELYRDALRELQKSKSLI